MSGRDWADFALRAFEQSAAPVPLSPAKALDQALEEEIVPLTTFIQDKGYLGLPPLSDEQFRAVKAMTDIFPDDPTTSINEGILVWGKGSVSSETLIVDAFTGRRMTIGQMAREGIAPRVAAYNHEIGRIEYIQASIPWKEGTDTLYKVTTTSGRFLIVQADHKFLKRATSNPTSRDFVPVWEAVNQETPHAVVGLATTHHVENPDLDIPEADAILLGCWLGSAVLQFQIPVFRTNFPAVLSLYLRTLDRKGLPYRVEGKGTARSEALVFITPKQTLGLWSESAATQIAKKWGLLSPDGTWIRSIPNDFWRLPEDRLRVFFAALFSSGGFLAIRKHFISLGIKNDDPGFLRDLQDLLMRIGVVAKVRSNEEGSILTIESLQALIRFFLKVNLIGREQRVKVALQVLRWMWKDNNRRGIRFHDHVVFEQIQSIERLHTGSYYTLEVPDRGNYVANGFYAHNSGKDHVSRIICARIVYQLLCLRDPMAFFGMPSSDYIHTLNVALSAQQANLIFFEPYKQMIAASPWFRDKWEETVGELAFNKHIISLSGHSQQNVQEGMNLMVAIMDEVAAFRTNDDLLRTINPAKAVTAENLYRVLRTSINSRFPGIGKLVMLSYPRHAEDFILTAYKLAQGDPRIYSSKRPTWEVHPKRKIEDFAQDFAKDPEGAWAMYGCKPTQSGDAFFRLRSRVYEFCRCIEGISSMDPIIDPAFADYLPPVDGYTVREDFLANHKLPCFIHIDLAVKQDACGIAMSHPTGVNLIEVPDSMEGTKLIKQPKVKIDFVHRIEAPPGGEIDIAAVRTIVLQLIERGFVIQRVTYDSYQSMESLQFFRNLGIYSDLLSVDRDLEPYNTLKMLVYNRRIEGVPDARLARELVNLILLKTNKVDHVRSESKDMSDAVAGSVTQSAQAAMFMDFPNTVMPGAFWRDDYSRPHESSGMFSREHYTPIASGSFRDGGSRPTFHTPG